MKNLFCTGVFALLFSAAASAQAPAKQTTLKVWGNCGMCKKTIDKAAKVKGVSAASWSPKTQMLTLAYDPKTVKPETVEASIAKAGYDTEHFTGDTKAYNNLHECCKYERKK